MATASDVPELYQGEAMSDAWKKEFQTAKVS
jgi:hypothetical protein